ncbi:MAG: hypothetical protein SGJ19_14165 [Planctomycetia bacterium]|nr:hypothetical protein [Planctomycetia bacterium]
MDDFLIDEVGIHYHASKNREYRNRVIARFSTFVGFLQSHGLTVRQLLGPHESLPTTLKIMRSDLTDEGFRLVKEAYDKWLKAMNSGQSATDTTLLDKALNKIRTES